MIKQSTALTKSDLLEIIQQAKEQENISDLLPGLLRLNNKPFSLERYAPFREFYNTHLPTQTVWKTGRQVSKTTNQGGQGAIQAVMIPGFNTLFVAPHPEQVERLSRLHVRRFLEESPIRLLAWGKGCRKKLSHISLVNGSNLYFVNILTDPGRSRGYSVDKIAIDEVQDFNIDFLPIIASTSDASDWRLFQFTGTPLTMDNTIEQLWQDSSQAEWVIKCEACGRYNIPSLEFHLNDMLGPEHPDYSKIGPGQAGIICYHCEKQLNPRNGFWEHKYPSRKETFPGYHVPQIVLPMHCENPINWSIIQSKRRGGFKTQIHQFYNEICGESYDFGAKLITDTDLRAAAVLHENKLEEAEKVVNDYVMTVMGIDWGGGGEEMDSLTTIAVAGLTPTGKVHVIYGWRSFYPHNYDYEHKQIVEIASRLRVTYFAHDFLNLGAIREHYLRQWGIPADKFIPFTYSGNLTTKHFVSYKQANPRTGQRAYYLLDKTRSIISTCEMIKTGFIQFFAYDYKGSEHPGLLRDFLSLVVEDRSDNPRSHMGILIMRNKNYGPDDFVHAVNFAVTSLHEIHKSWPNVVAAKGKGMTPEQKSRLGKRRRVILDMDD